MKTHIPHDIWALIAQFIPALCLRDLLTVNSTFFHIAMDCRYRQISFAYLDNRTLKSLSRLRDPLVAQRVRVLHLYPGFLKQVLEKDKGEKEKEKEVQKSPSRTSLRILFADVANQIRAYIERKKSQEHIARKFKTSQDIIAALLEVLGRLPNVTDYHIMWCGLPPVFTSPVPFLTAALQSNLRKLSLEISLENIEILLGPAFSTPKLEELDLMVRVDGIRSTFQQEWIMLDHLGPAINCLNPSLRSLSIQAWEPLDLSPLFHSIRRMPFLTSLSISIPTEEPHLGDPAGLSGFLNLHSGTLQELALKCTHYGGIGPRMECSSSLEDWISEVLRNVSLDYLTKLDISSSMFPVESSLLCLDKLGGSLSTLSMTGRYRTQRDIEQVLRVLTNQRSGVDGSKPGSASPSSPVTASAPTPTSWPGCDRLKMLRLGPVTLTPDLMDTLAVMLPGLVKLELFVKDVECEVMGEDIWTDEGNVMEDDDSIWSEGGHEVYDHLNHVANFCEVMEERIYDEWQLKSLSITLPSTLHPESQCEHDLKQAIARAIPSLLHWS
ncbi:hypothetical protein AX16_006860 [Volvariella volvacea WC 439]|nr:hypothetical protein AX16_006860 [Volvariella volvacea WC 439]